jgi:hypothetical protein
MTKSIHSESHHLSIFFVSRPFSQMLFDKVGIAGYYLYGSGVIPNRFIQIREAIKSMM